MCKRASEYARIICQFDLTKRRFTVIVISIVDWWYKNVISLKIIVLKVTIPGPLDKNIIPDRIAESIAGMSVYAELVRIMKESTTEYYNMRLALGLECA